MRTYEGAVEIGLEDFWEYVTGFLPNRADQITFGVPRINSSNDTIEIDFAASDDNNPSDWSIKPTALQQWEDLVIIDSSRGIKNANSIS